MQAKLLKIPLVSGSRPRVEELIQYMRDHIEEPGAEMLQKGYFWDSVFFGTQEGKEYLYVVVKSMDFEAIMRNEDGLVRTPFRAVYEEFRAACWQAGSYEEMEPLHCFNSAMEFSR